MAIYIADIEIEREKIYIYQKINQSKGSLLCTKTSLYCLYLLFNMMMGCTNVTDRCG